ncbi:MAG: hypothetical protein ABEJ65_11270, partial [bacterium]
YLIPLTFAKKKSNTCYFPAEKKCLNEGVDFNDPVLKNVLMRGVTGHFQDLPTGFEGATNPW